jgi:hypothetical protein
VLDTHVSPRRECRYNNRLDHSGVCSRRTLPGPLRADSCLGYGAFLRLDIELFLA